MKRIVFLFLALVFILSCCALAVEKAGIRFMPNKKYEITFLVRSSSLAPGSLEIKVDKMWKATRVETKDGSKDLFRVSGNFMFPYVIAEGIQLPAGAGETVVEHLKLETIDGKKFE